MRTGNAGSSDHTKAMKRISPGSALKLNELILCVSCRNDNLNVLERTNFITGQSQERTIPYVTAGENTNDNKAGTLMIFFMSLFL